MYNTNVAEASEDSKKAMASILRGAITDTKELYEMHDRGIAGLSTRVKLPEYSDTDNGNGNGYSDDFLSFYQTEGVKFLMDKKRVLIADDMGVGKTAQAVAGKLEIENRTGRRYKTLVITPNTVKEYWYKKIDEYCERKQKVVRLDSYSDRSFEGLDDADFTIVNYEAFSHTNGDGRVADRLRSQGFNYVILDEVHNIKNPDALRSLPIRQIADDAEYLCLLSGTPIPNSLRDTYMLISMLEKDAYPTAQDVRKTHWDQPRIIRSILQRRRLKREMKDVLKGDQKLPEMHGYEIPSEGTIELGQGQRALYNAIYENDELEGSVKLEQLRKALLDPSLVKPGVVPDDNIRGSLDLIGSAKYEALERIIKEKSGKEKIVVFTPLHTTGVTQKLERMLKKYGALRMDGDVPEKTGERERVRKMFQIEDDKRVLIASGIAGEGINLTAASTVIFLDEPYTPAEREQSIKRVYRRGQKKEVEVISLSVRDSIDEGVLELLGQKKEGIDFIEKGRELKPEHLQALLAEGWKTTPISRRLFTPQQGVMRLSSRMHDKGPEKITRASERNDGRLGKYYANNYCDGWETSYSANGARAYKTVIDAISKKGHVKRKIDLGSAFGVLSHITGDDSVTNVDLIKYHFESKLANPKNTNIVASIHDLPVPSQSFDLAVSALSLNYTSNDIAHGVSQRELAVREANRVLTPDGHFILTLPINLVSQEKALDIQHGLTRLGFEVIPELTGFVRSVNPDLAVFMAVGKKVSEPSDQTNGEEFRLQLRGKRLYATRKKGIAHEFVFFDPETDEEERMGDRLRIYQENL